MRRTHLVRLHLLARVVDAREQAHAHATARPVAQTRRLRPNRRAVRTRAEHVDFDRTMRAAAARTTAARAAAVGAGGVSAGGARVIAGLCGNLLGKGAKQVKELSVALGPQALSEKVHAPTEGRRWRRQRAVARRAGGCIGGRARARVRHAAERVRALAQRLREPLADGDEILAHTVCVLRDGAGEGGQGVWEGAGEGRGGEGRGGG